jgi:hypothetical protein
MFYTGASKKNDQKEGELTIILQKSSSTTNK